jgi:hypothetical protein
MTINEVVIGFSFLVSLVLLVGCIFGGINYSKNPSVSRWIFWYFVASLGLDIVSRYMGFFSSHGNNLFLFSVNALIDLIFFARLYIRFFQTNYKLLLQVVSVLVGTIVTANMAFHGDTIFVASFQAYDKLLCDGVIFIMALISMLDLLRGKGELKKEILRLNIVVLLYFSLDMLMSLIMNFLVNSELKYFLAYFWLLRLALLITLYIILIHTLWQTGKNRKHWLYG